MPIPAPLLLSTILALACGADDPGPAKAEEADSDTDADTDADPEPIPEDNVVNALRDCLGHQDTPEAYPNQLGEGSELQRYTLEAPEAVCNDGSRAVMYVRGATDDALADVWSIHLQGGGSCGSYLSCAIRWCGLDYYDWSKMSARDLPLEIAGYGIFDAEASNLLAGANQVFFYYCSSDAWRGQGSAAYDSDDLEVPAELPVEIPFMDASCWEHLGGTADEGLCYDNDYLMFNHITTPFFVRQDLRDIGGPAESIGLPEDLHEAAVVDMLSALASIQETAVEGADITVIPGAYGPNCPQHVALESSQLWALSTVRSGDLDLSFQQAVLAWYGGESVAVIDAPNSGTDDGPASTCGEVEDER